ncbi:MAG TPA: transposase, partial [Verrucomicrobiae bacterium]|nr:transposase [Verrucomicrobiae bacterium]
MARYKPRDYSQTQLVPVPLSDQLVPGTLEHTIHYVVEERLDLGAFDAEFKNDETGRWAYDPRVLLKVVLFGYARGLKGSRRLEAACRENVTFMALACGQRPDHSTIAAFINGMGHERIEDLFAQVLLVCAEEGLLGGTHFAIDGCRMSSNASKEWSGKRADLIRKRDKLKGLVRLAMEEHRRIDGGEGGGGRERRRLERLEKKAERIGRFLAENPARVGRQGEEVQANVTDNESAKMKSSHGIVQGYNANACVDGAHQVVVHAEAFGEGDDGAAAMPMLEGAAVNLAIAGMGDDALQEAVVSADTGYYTVENLKTCAAA